MKKMMLCSLLFPFCLCAMLVYTQYQSKQIELPLKQVSGDASLLQDVEIQTTLYSNSATQIQIKIEDGESNVSYQEKNIGSDDTKNEISQMEKLTLANPDMDPSKRETMENAYAYDQDGTKCEYYQYPQAYANVNLEFTAKIANQYYMNIEPVQTKLIKYSVGDYNIYASQTQCKSDQDDTILIRGSYDFAQRVINQASDNDFYTMPIIQPNMDGIATIYRYQKKSNEDMIVDQSQLWVPEAVYEFPVEKGMYGVMKVIDDTIYLWTWKEQTLTLQMFDESMNLLKEEQTQLPLKLEPSPTQITEEMLVLPNLYQSGDTIILELQNQLVAFDLPSGTRLALHTIAVTEDGLEEYYLNDAIYKNDKFYLTAEKPNLHIGDSFQPQNPMILIYDGNELLNHSDLVFYPEGQQNEISKVYRTTLFTRDDILRFVR